MSITTDTITCNGGGVVCGSAVWPGGSDTWATATSVKRTKFANSYVPHLDVTDCVFISYYSNLNSIASITVHKGGKLGIDFNGPVLQTPIITVAEGGYLDIPYPSKPSIGLIAATEACISQRTLENNSIFFIGTGIKVPKAGHASLILQHEPWDSMHLYCPVPIMNGDKARLALHGKLKLEQDCDIYDANDNPVVSNGTVVAIPEPTYSAYQGADIYDITCKSVYVAADGEWPPKDTILSIVNVTEENATLGSYSETYGQRLGLTVIGATAPDSQTLQHVTLRPSPTQGGVFIANANLVVDSDWSGGAEALYGSFFIGRSILWVGSRHESLGLGLSEGAGATLHAPNTSTHALHLKGNYRLTSDTNIYDVDGTPIVLNGKRV